MDEKTYIKEFNEILDNLEDRHNIKKIENIDEEFYGDLLFDSLSIVEFVLLCEEKFNIKIDDDKLVKLRTVRDFIKLIEEK